MKFCGSCGQQIDDNAPACPYCGAQQFPGEAVPVRPRRPKSNSGSRRKAPAGQISMSMPKFLMLIGAFTVFLSTFMGVIGSDGRYITMRVGGGGYNGLGAVALGWIATIVALLVCLVVVADVLFTDLGILTIGAAALQLVWFIVTFIWLLIQVNKEEFSYAELGLGAGFWFYLIGTIVLAAGAVLVFFGSKRR